MTKARRDLGWSIALSVISVAIFFYSNTFTSNIEAPTLAESSMYSKIWAGALFLLSVALMMRSLRKVSREEAKPLLTTGIIISVVALIIYLLALNTFGFLICTVLFLTGMITYYHRLSMEPSARRKQKISAFIVRAFILAIIVSVVLKFVFSGLFGVSLPTCIMLGI